MQVSFCGKIPISKVQIYDKNAQCFKEATLYEYDGQDASDIDDYAKYPGIWTYRHYITTDLASKKDTLDSMRRGKKLPEFKKHILERNRFYALESEEGRAAAVCETRGCFNMSDIHFLESDTKNYGLAGQAILASIAKQMLKQPEASFEVNDPAISAKKFYMEDCGFNEREPGSRILRMEEEEMEKFVSDVEERLQTTIEDVEG